MCYQNSTISVVIVTYKVFSYIYDTLDSIFAQDYPSIEIILSDDCSPLFPGQEIERYIETHKGENIINYSIIHNSENGGTVKNINIGISNSHGEYIKLIAGDDAYYDEHVFTNQLSVFLQNPDLMIVTGKTCECDANMKPIFKEQVEKTNAVLNEIFSLEPKEYFRRCSNEQLFPLVTQALLIRREFFEKYGLYDERYRLLEDPPMDKRIIINKVPVGVADCIVIKHRASVGISSNDQLFVSKQSQYYLDLANYVKYELLTRPEYFPHFRTKQRYKKELYRYEMSVAKTKGKKILLTIKNIDTAFWFFFFNTNRAKEKIRILFSKKK